MKFLLFRHAHKGIMPFNDPELSPQGLEQAHHLIQMINQNKLVKPTHLLVSPRKRAQQTFLPISQHFKIKIETDSDLDQRQQNESSSDFRKRIQSFMNQLEISAKPQTVVFACTHYDWLEESMSIINCSQNLNTFEFSHWAPTQHLEFEWQDGIWKLIGKGVSA